MKTKRAFSNATAHRLQLRHFQLIWLLPDIAALGLIPVVGFPTSSDLALLIIGWLLTTIGVSVGFHRLFTHKSFKTYTPIEAALAILGMMAGAGSLISWVSIHRRHHELSDKTGDPHSPVIPQLGHTESRIDKMRGILHAHAGWMRRHDYPDPTFYCRDLYKKAGLMWISRRYAWWLTLGFVLPALAGGVVEQSWSGAFRGFYFGGLLRIVVVHHAISAVNSICHSFGSTRYETGDRSTNCWWLAVPTVGESWHNNHHGIQTSAFFGHRWWELDLGGYLIWSCLLYTSPSPRDRG